jgi:hypothetical protein
MYVAANGLTVPKKGDGILAYLPVAHAKAQEREIEYKAREEKRIETEGSSEHVGQVKDRITVTGTVMSVFEKPGDWGTTFITKILGDDGNVYKWFGSSDLGRGNRVTGKATVKKHDEFKGVKETVISRPDFRDADAPENVKPKKGETVTYTVKIGDETVEAEVTKITSGFRVTYQGTVEEAARWNQVERAVVEAHWQATRDAERAAWLAEKLPEGTTAKMGAYNPYAMHRAYDPSRCVQEGEMVALRPRRDGDFRLDGGNYMPARPNEGDEKLADLTYAPVQIEERDRAAGTASRSTRTAPRSTSANSK